MVNQDRRSKGIAYIEFKSEAVAEKNFEEKQGAEIDGQSVLLYYTGEKGQQRQERAGKNSTWGGESKTLVSSNLSYSATEETLQEVFEKTTFIKVPQNQQGKSKGVWFVDFNSEEDAKLSRRSWKMEKLMGTKLPWTGPNLRVKVAVVAKAVAKEEEVNLVTEAWGGGRGEGVLEVEETSKVADFNPQGKKMKFD
ncbi:NCL [Lemmus lemmus]